MIKLDFFNTNKKLSVVVNRTKYIKYLDFSEYWIYNRSIHNSILKTSASEYREENGGSIGITIDGEILSKSDEIYYVSHNFDVDEDLKIGSKSLMLKYIARIIENNSFSDELMQLNTMFDLVTSLLSDEHISLTHSEFNQKTLPKLLSASILKDGFSCNGSDFSYEELIVYQLDLINACFDKSKRTIVFVDTTFLTSAIKEKIEQMDHQIIVISLFFTTQIRNFKNNLCIGRYDLENDTDLYERMIIMEKYFDINDYKQHLINKYLSDSQI